jgi:hypothetical protein
MSGARSASGAVGASRVGIAGRGLVGTEKARTSAAAAPEVTDVSGCESITSTGGADVRGDADVSWLGVGVAGEGSGAGLGGVSGLAIEGAAWSRTTGRASGCGTTGGGSGTGSAGGFVDGGLSYDVRPPSMTSNVGWPSAEKNRNSCSR